MKIKYLGLVVALAVAAGCMESQPLGEAPPAAEIERVAKLAHQKAYGGTPVGLQIGQVHRAPVFFDSDEFLICVTTREKTLGPTYDDAGALLAPSGTSFRQSHAMLMKVYGSTWGSGIYRNVEAGKIGQVQMRDYCPASERSW